MTDNRNLLFLSEMNRNKNISEHSKLVVFRRIFEWFSSDLVIYSPNTPITNFEYYYDADSLETVNRLIESFDTGISEVRIDKLSMEDISSKLPKEIFVDIVEEIKEIFPYIYPTNISVSNYQHSFLQTISRHAEIIPDP